jgi:phosphoribosylamine--glycine ligase
VVIPRIQNDLVELLVATAKGTLTELQVKKDPRYATTVVAVSGGYPGDYQKGFAIKGLVGTSENGMLFHMGTKADAGNITTNGGRVLCATALADNLESAIGRSRQMIEQVSFEGKYYRRDIGYEFGASPIPSSGGAQV